MKLGIVFFAVYLTLADCQIISCPTKENIRPCSCLIGQDDRPSISCENLKSADVLVKATTNMKGYFISSFTLLKSEIGIMPSDVFRGMEIHSLKIENCNLTKLGDSRSRPPFLGLESSLRSIQIKESFVNKNSPLAALSLSHLKNLDLIQLEGNLIPTIGNNWFESGPYNLKDLYITDANTSVLGSHAFESLENLRTFTLSSSMLSEISRDMFPDPADSLITIDLSRNKLKLLPNNIFSKMPSLEQIFLEYNYFTTIDEVIYAPVWSQLDYVYFHGNPIVCNSNIKWIYKYRLPEHFVGFCDSPEKLRNRSFGDLVITDLE